MPIKRKSLSSKTRFEVFKRDSFTCQYCGRAAPEIVLHLDHVQPVSKDGDESVFNYITSCIDCNLGKSDRELSDDSVLQKQKAQLDELQERREQIEMMLEWRNGLKELNQDALDIALKACDDLTPGWTVAESGKIALKKLIKKFGLPAVLDAIDTSGNYLERDTDADFTTESVNTAFNKLPGICQMNSLPEWKQQLYHVRNIARKQAWSPWSPSTANDVFRLLEQSYSVGVPIEELKQLAIQGLNYTNLSRTLQEWISEVERRG